MSSDINLIDWNAENVKSQEVQLPPPLLPPPTTFHERLSLSNDPFEVLTRRNDPFELYSPSKKEVFEKEKPVPQSKLVELDSSDNSMIVKELGSLKCDASSGVSPSYSNRRRIQSDPDVCQMKHTENTNKLKNSSYDQSSINLATKRLQMLKMQSGGKSPLSSPSRLIRSKFANILSNQQHQGINELAHNLTDESFEDLMAISPNWVDSETDYDSDLEQLKIPFLCNDNENNNGLTEEDENVMAKNPKLNETKGANVTDEAVTRLKAKMEQIRSTASDHLAEGNSAEGGSKEGDEKEENDLKLPQPIIRQGTFDIDKSVDRETEATESANVLKQIVNLFGNQHVNIVQTDMKDFLQNNQQSATSGPTVIVVMNQGTVNMASSSSPQLPEVKFADEVEIVKYKNEIHLPRRSMSLSSTKKPIEVVKALQNSIKIESKQPICNTPVRSVNRRSSFSSTSFKERNLPSRRSFNCSTTVPESYRPTGTSSQHSLFGGTPRKPTMPSVAKNLVDKSLHPLIGNNKLAIRKTSNKQSLGPTISTRGPMKATIPVKNVIPTIVVNQLPPTPSTRDMTQSPVATSTPRLVETHLSKPTKKIPSPRSITGNHRQINAGLKSPVATTKLKRLSYMSATPNPKSSNTGAVIMRINHRRSMSDFKKSDNSSKDGDGLTTAAGVQRATSIRTPSSRIHRESFLVKKFAPVKLITKMISDGDSGDVCHVNKENKIPK